mgnify:CR=1 FL=1
MKSFFLTLASFALAATAHAQWQNTTYTLKGGWNAIYLPGDATYNTIDNLFPSTVLEVWRWQRRWWLPYLSVSSSHRNHCHLPLRGLFPAISHL